MCPIEVENICIYSVLKWIIRKGIVVRKLILPKPGKLEGKNISDEQLTPFFPETDYHYFVKSSM